MASSLHEDSIRKYFIDPHLRRYVSEDTRLETAVFRDFERDALVLYVIVTRADGKTMKLSSDLHLDPSNWPRPSKELIAQLMMVG